MQKINESWTNGKTHRENDLGASATYHKCVLNMACKDMWHVRLHVFPIQASLVSGSTKMQINYILMKKVVKI